MELFLHKMLEGGEPFLEGEADRTQGDAVGEDNIPVYVHLFIRQCLKGQ